MIRRIKKTKIQFNNDDNIIEDTISSELSLENNNTSKRWRADFGDGYFYIDSTGKAVFDVESGYFVDDLRYEQGNYFSDEKTATIVSKLYKSINLQF
jgi:hypothetical protein